jgi:hydrogenase maturation protease
LKRKKKIILVGVGNTLRGDDGIGAYICARFDQLNIEGLTTMVTQQLNTELVDDFLEYDSIILADAAISGGPVAWHPLKTETALPVSSSHHVNAGLLNALAKQLYHKKLPIMCCAVKGENFEMGEQLSATAKKNADDAVAIICTWVSNQCF